MKAYVFTEKGKVELRDIADVRLDPGNEADLGAAVLEPVYVSPCSSDVHTVYAGNGPRRADLVLGHEGIARVLETGPGVKDFKSGEIVAVSAVMPERGDKTGHMGAPFSASKLGRNINGMWAERFRVPDADFNLSHIPEGLSMESALMAVDMMATGFTAAEEADIDDSMTVLIIGSGAVGLMAAAAASVRGAWRIYMTGTDRSTVNISLAERYGVDAYISHRTGKLIFGDDDAADAMREWQEGITEHPDGRANYTGSAATETVFALTRGIGADRVIVAGGDVLSFAQASDTLRYGSGTAVNVAYMEGAGTIGLPIFSLGRGMAGKTFKFCLSRGGRKWTEMMLGTAGRLEVSAMAPPGALVTHHMKGFDSIPQALSLMRERPAGLIKIMVEI